MPDGTKLGKAKLRGVESSGMILAEDEVGIGEDHAGTWCSTATCRRASRCAEHLPIADEVLELEITPNRPDAWPSTASRASCTRSPGRRWRQDPTDADAEPSGDDGAEDHASIEIADPEICLRFTGARVRGREGRPVAAVAEAAADGGRPAADLERRRHHELRDAR